MPRGFGLGQWLRRGPALVFMAAACVSVGGPLTFRFYSNLATADAVSCAAALLRLRGFETVDSTPAADSVRAVRPATPVASGATEWWRVDIAVSPGPYGGSVVRSVLGASERREGPYGEPPERLEDVAAELSARCTWPSVR